MPGDAGQILFLEERLEFEVDLFACQDEVAERPPVVPHTCTVLVLDALETESVNGIPLFAGQFQKWENACRRGLSTVVHLDLQVDHRTAQ